MLFLAICFNKSYSQDLNDINYKKFVTSVTLKDSVILLPDKFLIDKSIKIYSDSAAVPDNLYRIDNRYGKIYLDKQIKNFIFSDSLKNRAGIIIVYKNYPFDIPDSYSKFEVLTQIDSTKQDSVKVAEVKTDFIEDIFAGTNLEKSGSIFRGFTLGNNRDLTLNSGFRLQMTGKLSSDIDITAALTDENTPIQPEGNTQKLQEIDKVFVELRAKNITTTLGDIDVNFTNLDFFSFSRKVQGAKGFADFGNNNFFIAAALSRGQFNSNSFPGIDGVQGPYKLLGINKEINIIILAGTERVYLDGQKMARGENADYTIDYSNGQITFTNRRLITNASRITVDFEYSERKYSRSFISGQANTSLFNDRMKLTFSFLREKDDRNKPIDFTLSDSDKAIISNAGNDNIKASKSGVQYVGRDSTGKTLGQYIQKQDSTNGFIYYKYAPGDTAALYTVTFSFVGSGLGDYTSLSTTSYSYTGQGRGSYLPIIFFPLPVLYQSGDMNLDLKLSRSFSFHVETAVSDMDRNLFSDVDDRGNKGVALNTNLLFTNPSFKIGNINLGDVRFLVRNRFINRLYNSLDRLNDVEYNRVWDIVDSSKQTENVSEAEFSFRPKQYLSLSSSGGRIKRGDSFTSYRANVDLNFIGDSLGLPFISYTGDYISSKDNKLDYKGRWLRHNGKIDYQIHPLKKKETLFDLMFEINGEDKEINTAGADTSTTGSYRYYEFKPKASLLSFLHADFSYEFNYRFDDVFDSIKLSRQSNSLIHTYSFRLKDFDFLASNLDVVVYDKKYSQQFLSRGFLDNRTILVTSQSNLWFFNRGLQAGIFYKVSSERTAKSQVVFVKVPVGQGNYKYLGDINGNGVPDENEFILVNFDGDYIKVIIPTDQLFPTTDLQTSLSFNLNPSKFIKMNNSVLSEILNNITFDTYASLNEKSKDPVQKNIYLIKFWTFQNETNTITGLNSIQQDVNMFDNNRYFGARLRFIQRKGFNQYYSGNERLLSVERSARVRLSFTSDLSLITDYVSETNRNLAPQLTTRNWNINGNSVISDLTYMPIRNIEFGFRLELKRASDVYPFNPTEANINRQTARFSYSLEGKGRIRAEIERNEVTLSDNPLFLPYELTKGLNGGKSFFWNVSFEYRLTNFIQATINYLGRAEGNSKVIHTGTAEVRAYF
jgi:hypothetical protein